MRLKACEVGAARSSAPAQLHSTLLQGRKLLATVGGDTSSLDGVTMRLWDPAAILAASGTGGGLAPAAAPGPGIPSGADAGAAAVAAPPLAAATATATVRLFPAKQPPAGSVSALAVSDAAWPQLQIAVGLSGGGVQLMRGDADKPQGAVFCLLQGAGRQCDSLLASP